MYSEQEARNKTCPLYQVALGIIRAVSIVKGSIVYNMDAANGPLTGCEGSSCMMWRYDNDRDDRLDGSAGWCGLASKPD